MYEKHGQVFISGIKAMRKKNLWSLLFCSVCVDGYWISAPGCLWWKIEFWPEELAFHPGAQRPLDCKLRKFKQIWQPCIFFHLAEVFFFFNTRNMNHAKRANKKISWSRLELNKKWQGSIGGQVTTLINEKKNIEVWRISRGAGNNFYILKKKHWNLADFQAKSRSSDVVSSISETERLVVFSSSFFSVDFINVHLNDTDYWRILKYFDVFKILDTMINNNHT